ncbi:ATP-binding protein [Streptomyces sp. NPDC001118]|uniref:ATP-binding protein n=1 Tax=Streptomyces sp. CG4 TaxID=408783 RepID=UPI0034E1ED22
MENDHSSAKAGCEPPDAGPGKFDGVFLMTLSETATEERWVGTARHFAASLPARRDVAPEDQDSVLLIIGELVGNAAQRGRADMIVSLTFEGRAVCIEVADSGASGPSPSPQAGLALA